MSITISWANYNQPATETQVYRSAVPITEGVPAELIATLPGGTVRYVDTNTVLGLTYYYQLVFKLGNETLAGVPFSVKAELDVGPGPKELIAGNSAFGYFGTISAIDLDYNFSDYVVGGVTMVHKLLHSGKIIYTPGISALAISAARSRKIFNTGVAQAFGQPADAADGQQITISGHRFNPRVAKFFDRGNLDTTPANYAVGSTSKMPMGKSEFLDLQGVFTRLATDVRRRAPFRLSNFSPMPNVSGGNPTFTCDWMSAARTGYVGLGSLNLVDSVATSVISVAPTAGSTSCIPVLEYVGV